MTPPVAVILDPDDTLLAAHRQPVRMWFAIISEQATAGAGAA